MIVFVCDGCPPGTPEADLCHYCTLELQERRAGDALGKLVETSSKIDDGEPCDIGRAIVYALVTGQDEPEGLRDALTYALGVTAPEVEP